MGIQSLCLRLLVVTLKCPRSRSTSPTAILMTSVSRSALFIASAR